MQCTKITGSCCLAECTDRIHFRNLNNYFLFVNAAHCHPLNHVVKQRGQAANIMNPKPLQGMLICQAEPGDLALGQGKPGAPGQDLP